MDKLLHHFCIFGFLPAGFEAPLPSILHLSKHASSETLIQYRSGYIQKRSFYGRSGTLRSAASEIQTETTMPLSKGPGSVHGYHCISPQHVRAMEPIRARMISISTRNEMMSPRSHPDPDPGFFALNERSVACVSKYAGMSKRMFYHNGRRDHCVEKMSALWSNLCKRDRSRCRGTSVHPVAEAAHDHAVQQCKKSCCERVV